MSIERQIEQIVDKDSLHRMIDRLPETTKMLILMDEEGTNSFNCFGSPSHKDLLYMIENFKNGYMFGCSCGYGGDEGEPA